MISMNAGRRIALSGSSLRASYVRTHIIINAEKLLAMSLLCDKNYKKKHVDLLDWRRRRLQIVST